MVEIDLNRPMSEVRATLSGYPVATRLSLTGPMIVARDIAHAKLKERLDCGEELPQYFKDLCVYYAGPAKTPEGYASGSFGPTTAGRMDTYVDQFQAAGGSMVMLAKGNRSVQVTNACKKHGGFYLGSIGGPAARLAKDSIREVSVVEYPELGMEAIWRIQVERFPAFIVVDDKGNDFSGLARYTRAGVAPRQDRAVTPEPFKLIQGAAWRVEDVHHERSVVDQHPLAVIGTLDPQRGRSPGRLEALGDPVGDGAHLPGIVAVGNDEQIGDREHIAHIDDDRVDPRAVIRGRSRRERPAPDLRTLARNIGASAIGADAIHDSNIGASAIGAGAISTRSIHVGCRAA